MAGCTRCSTKGQDDGGGGPGNPVACLALAPARYNPHLQIVGFTVHACSAYVQTCTPQPQASHARHSESSARSCLCLYQVGPEQTSRRFERARERERRAGPPPPARSPMFPALSPSPPPPPPRLPSETGWTHGCGTSLGVAIARGTIKKGTAWMAWMACHGRLGRHGVHEGNDGKRETGNGRQSARNIGSVSVLLSTSIIAQRRQAPQSQCGPPPRCPSQRPQTSASGPRVTTTGLCLKPPERVTRERPTTDRRRGGGPPPSTSLPSIKRLRATGVSPQHALRDATLCGVTGEHWPPSRSGRRPSCGLSCCHVGWLHGGVCCSSCSQFSRR